MFACIIMVLIVNACIAGTIPATPENITVTFLTPSTVRVSWQTMIDLNAHPVEKYIVTYKPTDDRVVQDVAGNSEAIILDRLTPGTQYSIAVTAVWLGKKYRSRQVIFRTLDSPKAFTQDLINVATALNSGIGAGGETNFSSNANANSSEDGVTSTVTNLLSHGAHRELPTIRGVEVGIVLMVLMVWAGAIALFFNRWGKIRMLLPYQPDYKHEQLKVPGTGVCTGGVCSGQHSHQFDSSECGALAYQPLNCSRHFHATQGEPSRSISERITRSRINSAIFVSSEGGGFDSIEFLRRHGSQSVLCRKAKSAENITDNDRKKSFSENRHWHTDESNTTDSQNYDGIEMHECSKSIENHPVAILKSNVEKLLAATSVLNHSATVTTSNRIVGSISIETPPSHIREEQHTIAPITVASKPSPLSSELIHHPTLNSSAKMVSLKSASHDSADSVEELVPIPIDITTRKSPAIDSITKTSKVLVRQHSSTSSPVLSSAHNSPKALKLKYIKPKLKNLPMVSVSGPSPSPSDEKSPPGECL